MPTLILSLVILGLAVAFPNGAACQLKWVKSFSISGPPIPCMSDPGQTRFQGGILPAGSPFKIFEFKGELLASGNARTTCAGVYSSVPLISLSSDRGTTWGASLVSAQQAVSVQAVVGTTLFVSGNGLANILSVPTVQMQFGCLYFFQTSKDIFASDCTVGTTFERLMRSGDSGKTWQPISFTSIPELINRGSGPPCAALAELVLCGGEYKTFTTVPTLAPSTVGPLRFFLSLDAGNSWEEVGYPQGTGPPMLFQGIFATQSSFLVLFQTQITSATPQANSYLATSKDGLNWKVPVVMPWTPAFQVDSASRIWGFSYSQAYGISASEDDGVSWQYVVTGLPIEAPRPGNYPATFYGYVFYQLPGQTPSNLPYYLQVEPADSAPGVVPSYNVYLLDSSSEVNRRIK